jgi:alpha-L-arabinofuranosidase
MSYAADVRFDPARTLGAIDPFVYGQFVEQIGRAVYGGLVEPGSPHSDDEGVRLDVLAAALDLQPTLLRWPGGNFASGYHWRDGIGPVDERPLRRDLAWATLEPNTFGTEEFLSYCRRLGAAPYLNLNASTGTVDEAVGWLEYCNATDDLPEARLRRNGPHPEPHDVLVWGIGNENYGWWQHGHSTAAEYASVAREWGKLLRWADTRVRVVAVGTNDDPDWNWTVLTQAGRFIDYLSLHFYWAGDDADMYHGTLAGPIRAERDVVATWGMCLAAQKKLQLPAPPRIAVDEWGVWSRTNRSSSGDVPLFDLMRYGLTARNGIDVRFEEPYDLTDALAVATWLHVLWRHPEKIGLATQAQMVNVLAPIHVHADGVVRHTVFHPLALARAYAGEVAVDVHVATDTQVSAPSLTLPALDVAATAGERRLHLSLVNRHRDEEAVVRVHGASGTWRRATLTADDPAAGNTVAAPDAVVPAYDEVSLDEPLRVPPHAHVTLWCD